MMKFMCGPNHSTQWPQKLSFLSTRVGVWNDTVHTDGRTDVFADLTRLHRQTV